jgi:hypothetical protein
MGRRVKNIPLIIAVILIIAAGVGFYTILQNSTNSVRIAVAKEDLAAYTFVDEGSFDFKAVPKGAVTDNVLTQADYEALYKSDGEDKGTTLTYPFLQGQWILEEGLSTEPEQSFAVVRPDERVIAATTTDVGAALFTIRAGDVVDVASSGGSLGGANFVKVICISTTSNCQNVLPAAEGVSGGSSSVPGSGGGSGGVQLLLAVPASSASSIAGQSISLTLNPFCGVDRQGYFTSRTTADSTRRACDFPSGRDASARPKKETAEDVLDATGNEQKESAAANNNP